MYQKLYRAGLFSYLILLILAVLFYKERTVFIDIAYHLFHILRSDDFAIQNNRFGAVVTQIFPLLTGKMGLPLATVAQFYSAGFIVFYFLCYILSGSVLKQYKIALIFLLSTTLFVTDTFYWIQSELPQGLAFMLLFFAFMNTVKDNKRGLLLLPIMALAVIMLVFFHPLLVFPFLFVIVYYYVLDKGFTNNSKIVIGSVVFFIIVLVIKSVFYKTPYDTSAMGGAKNFKYLFPNYFDIPRNKIFLISCLKKYQWIPIIATTITALLFLQKKWTKLVFFLISFIGMILLVNVSYAFVPVEAFYIENLYLPLGIILAVPLVLDILPTIESHKKYSWLSTTLFVTILVTAIVRVYLAATPFTERLNWERAYLKEHKDEKLLVSSTEEQRKKLMMTWGTSYEFWLLSTIENGETASIVITDNVQEVEWAKGYRNTFVTMWGVFNYNDMPARYFKFTDTTSDYRIVK